MDLRAEGALGGRDQQVGDAVGRQAPTRREQVEALEARQHPEGVRRLVAVSSGTAAAEVGEPSRFEVTVTNNSKVARSYQLVPAGQPCNSGVVLENGWVEAGETKTGTFRDPRERLTARFCVDLRPEAAVRFTRGEPETVRLVARSRDRSDVSVEHSDLNMLGSDITVGFENKTPWRVQWVSKDDELECASSVDHPFFAPFSKGSTSFVKSEHAGICALGSIARAVWDIHRDDASGPVLATITVNVDTARRTQQTICNALGPDIGCLTQFNVVELTRNPTDRAQ